MAEIKVNTDGRGHRDNNIDEVYANAAVIREVFSDNGNTFIVISYRDNKCRKCMEQSVRLLVTEHTKIISETGRRICPEDLVVGMIVNAVFSSAMTRSIPPQSIAFAISIVDIGDKAAVTEGNIFDIDCRNGFVYVMDSRRQLIRFVVNGDTDIRNARCQQIPFCRLGNDRRVRVVHATFMTASIPPQTTAYSIQIVR